MEARDTLIHGIRPTIASNHPDTMSEFENFQNRTLRPILKLQNDIIVTIAKDTLQKRKKRIDRSSSAAMTLALRQWLREDHKTKDALTHLVVALLDSSELEYYLRNSSVIRKRIASMLTERIVDQLVE